MRILGTIHYEIAFFLEISSHLINSIEILGKKKKKRSKSLKIPPENDPWTNDDSS